MTTRSAAIAISLMLMAGMCYSTETDKDVQQMIKTMKKRLKACTIEDRTVRYDASESVKKMKPDGSWPGIDYGSKATQNWPGNEHLNRMVDMSIVYAGDSKHPLYKDDRLLQAILKSIDFWFARNPTKDNPNWWYREMQPQMDLGQRVCLLMEPHISKEQRAQMVGILQSSVPKNATGANLVWFAENTFFKGMYLEDYTMMKHAVTALGRAFTPAYKTAQNVAKEGVQPDGSPRGSRAIAISGAWTTCRTSGRGSLRPSEWPLKESQGLSRRSGTTCMAD